MIDEQETDLLVLHAIRVKGFVDEDGLIEVTGLPREVVDQALAAHARANLVTHREGRFPGWGLTTKGRDAHRAQLAEHLDSSGQRPLLLAAYEQFPPINSVFKQICTDWQLRPVPGSAHVPNDHSDEQYDKGVIGRLEDIHDQIGEPLAVLRPVRRFGRYRPRLDQALARVVSGDSSAFARPMSNSYHDVWMELHEDLLVSLDRARSEADGH